MINRRITASSWPKHPVVEGPSERRPRMVVSGHNRRLTTNA